MADLVTLQEYKDYKGISTTDEDTRYGVLLTHASDLVKTYCDRTFIDYVSNDKTEMFDAVDNSSVFIQEFPIISVTSVTTTIDGGTTPVTLVAGTDYFLKNDIGQITTGDGTPFLIAAVPPFNSLTIVYKGGYAATPEDLKLVVMDIVNYYFTSGFNPNKRLGSASLDTVSFSKLGDTAFPPHIKRVLDLYRSIRV